MMLIKDVIVRVDKLSIDNFVSDGRIIGTRLFVNGNPLNEDYYGCIYSNFNPMETQLKDISHRISNIRYCSFSSIIVDVRILKTRCGEIIKNLIDAHIVYKFKATYNSDSSLRSIEFFHITDIKELRTMKIDKIFGDD